MNRLSISMLNGHIPDDTQGLIDKGEIKEKFCVEAEYKFEGRVGDKLVGVIVYREGKFADGNIAPQFVHVIINPEFRGKDEPRELLERSEMTLKCLGYTQVYAHIPHGKTYMHRSAKHHGYEEWSQDEEGIFYYKNL